MIGDELPAGRPAWSWEAQAEAASWQAATSSW